MPERYLQLPNIYEEGDFMDVLLKDIDESNWIECIFLTTDNNNNHHLLERFVASNAFSIAQSKIEDGWTIKAIYHRDIIVGFTMYGYSIKNNFYELCRIMVDHKYQNKGIGKKAIGLIINKLSQIRECKEIYLSFHPENNVARRLYEQCGFKDTGRIVDHEVLYCLNLQDYR
jgi:diamine N-acetyltransferase